MPPQAGNGNKVLYTVLAVAFALLVALGSTVVDNAMANAVDNVRINRLEKAYDEINAKLDRILEQRP